MTQENLGNIYDVTIILIPEYKLSMFEQNE